MIKVINNKTIENALNSFGHQYFAGHLKVKQHLSHIEDTNNNIGIGYHHQFGFEQPHYHTECNEYQYVIKGKAKYVDLTNNIQYNLKKGDFFLIEKNTCYILKAKKGCKIIFFKNPAVDDKKIIELDEHMKNWVKKWRTNWDDPIKEQPFIIEHNNLIKLYKKDKGISPSNKREFFNKEILKDISIKAIKISTLIFAGASTIFGVISPFRFFNDFFRSNQALFLLFIIFFLAFFGYFIWELLKYRNLNIKEVIDGSEFIIWEEDYIVNMIRLLCEKKSSKNNIHVIFALGMNEELLRRAIENPKNESNEYKSIARDFYNFMNDYYGININTELKKHFDKTKEHLPKKGDVFKMDYTLQKSIKYEDFDVLENTTFTVLHYVNSTQDESDDEQVEDARETVYHIIDKISDYNFDYKKGNLVQTKVMIPAIGSGESGNGSYKNILIEILNNIFIPNSSIPDQVILSLRDYSILKSEYSANALIKIAKMINKN